MKLLVEYSDIDFQNLLQVLEWLSINSPHELYPRKWFEKRSGLINALLNHLEVTNCKFKSLPNMLRIRLEQERIACGEIVREIGGR